MLDFAILDRVKLVRCLPSIRWEQLIGHKGSHGVAIAFLPKNFFHSFRLWNNAFVKSPVYLGSRQVSDLKSEIE